MCRSGVSWQRYRGSDLSRPGAEAHRGVADSDRAISVSLTEAIRRQALNSSALRRLSTASARCSQSNSRRLFRPAEHPAADPDDGVRTIRDGHSRPHRSSAGTGQREKNGLRQIRQQRPRDAMTFATACAKQRSVPRGAATASWRCHRDRPLQRPSSPRRARQSRLFSAHIPAMSRAESSTWREWLGTMLVQAYTHHPCVHRS